MRFHHHAIAEQGQIWLDGDDRVLSAEYDPPYWHIVVMEFGQWQFEDPKNTTKVQQFDGSEGA